ncbi:MAG: dihydrofolate reductase family protein [Terriglobus sp.]
MRKLEIFVHTSLDGIVQHTEDENNFAHAGWTLPFRTPEGLAKLSALYGDSYDILLGRRTYDILAAYWPTAPSSPVADRLNAGTKYVATHRNENLTWTHSEVVGPDLIGDLRHLKLQDGPDIIVLGSSMLLTPLLESDLVDELIVSVFPVIIGTGKRLFTEGTPQTFQFLGTDTTSTGVLINRYKPTGALKSN